MTLPPIGWLELPNEYALFVYSSLAKGAGHKHWKKVPTGKFRTKRDGSQGAQIYRYFYKPTSSGAASAGHEDHFVVGASFQANGGHWHIKSVNGDKLTISHDESGDSKTLSKKDLANMLHEEHKTAIEKHKSETEKRAAAEKEEVAKYGTEKQKKRAGIEPKLADSWGGATKDTMSLTHWKALVSDHAHEKSKKSSKEPMDGDWFRSANVNDYLNRAYNAGEPAKMAAATVHAKWNGELMARVDPSESLRRVMREGILRGIDRKEADESRAPTDLKASDALPGLTASSHDLPFNTARIAHSGTSHVPEQRAKQEQASYLADMQSFADQLAKIATPENKDALEAAFNEYKRGYLSRKVAQLDAKSRTMSSMVTGPARFPTARNEKRLDVEQKRVEELIDWDKKFRAQTLAEHDPKGPKVVSSDREDAPKLIDDKLAQAKANHEMMVNANKVYRDKKLSDDQKVEKLVAMGVPPVVARGRLKPDFAGRIGFTSYEITNSSANIKRMEDRQKVIERERATETTEHEFDGGKIVDSAESNRVQIFFDSKPSPEKIAALKSRGFKWAPSEGAWQRMRSNDARYAASSITGAKMQKASTDGNLSKGTPMITWIPLTQSFGEAIWAASLNKAAIPADSRDGSQVVRLPYFVAKAFVGPMLAKAGGSYTKRVPTGKYRMKKDGSQGAMIYRYFYGTPHHMTSHEDMKAGTSYKHADGELTIHGVKDGKLQVSHSKKPGKIEHITHDELASRLSAQHGGAIAAEKEKLTKRLHQDLADAKEYGSAKHVQRILDEMKKRGVEPQKSPEATKIVPTESLPKAWEEWGDRPKGKAVDFTGHPWAGELGKIGKDRFGVIVTKKDGETRGRGDDKKTYGDAKVQVSGVFGFDYGQMVQDSKTGLEKIDPAKVAAKSNAKGWVRDPATKKLVQVDVTEEDFKQAYAELAESIQKSIDREHDKETGLRPLEIDGKKLPGIKVYRGGDDAYTGSPQNKPKPDTIYVSCMKINSIELEPPPNGYHDAQSAPKTVAKDILTKMLPLGHYRNYKLRRGGDWTIRVDGLDLKAEDVERALSLMKGTRKMYKAEQWESDDTGFDPLDPFSTVGTIEGGIIELPSTKSLVKAGFTWVPMSESFGEKVWSTSLNKAAIPANALDGSQTIELPYFVAKAFLGPTLAKAGGAYSKRVPTGKFRVKKDGSQGGMIYRYFYGVHHGSGIHNKEHFVEGASFAHGKGHMTIHGVKDGKLHVKHADGKEEHLTHDELSSKLEAHHKDALDKHKEKLTKEHAEALESGNEKGAKRIRDEAAKIGHKIGEPKAKKELSPEQSPENQARAKRKVAQSKANERAEEKRGGGQDKMSARERFESVYAKHIAKDQPHLSEDDVKKRAKLMLDAVERGAASWDGPSMRATAKELGVKLGMASLADHLTDGAYSRKVAEAKAAKADAAARRASPEGKAEAAEKRLQALAAVNQEKADKLSRKASAAADDELRDAGATQEDLDAAAALFKRPSADKTKAEAPKVEPKAQSATPKEEPSPGDDISRSDADYLAEPQQKTVHLKNDAPIVRSLIDAIEKAPNRGLHVTRRSNGQVTFTDGPMGKHHASLTYLPGSQQLMLLPSQRGEWDTPHDEHAGRTANAKMSRTLEDIKANLKGRYHGAEADQAEREARMSNAANKPKAEPKPVESKPEPKAPDNKPSHETHVAEAKSRYNLKGREAERFEAHEHVKKAKEFREAGDHTKADRYLREAVKETLYKTPERNMSPSSADKYMKEREKKQLEKALGIVASLLKAGPEDITYNKPRRIREGEPGYGVKKFVVHAKASDGRTRVIRFGDAEMEIKRDDPVRRKNFRARHNCDEGETDILSAKYWSCRQWRSGAKVED